MSVGTLRVGEELAPDVDRDGVGRSEKAFEQQGALQGAVKRVVGGEADAGQHLLAVRRDGLRGPSGRCLGERGGEGARFVAGRVERRVERLDRDERLGEAVANGLERCDRASELHPLDRVVTREGEHRSRRSRDLVRDRAPGEGHGGVPCNRVERDVDAGGVFDARDVQPGVRIDPLHRPELDRRRGNGECASPRCAAAHDEQVAGRAGASGRQSERVRRVTVDVTGHTPRTELR